MAADREDCQLYLITPRSFEAVSFARLLAETLDAGDVACLQLRLKGADDDAVRRAAEAIRPVCHDRDVAFVMNDRPDLARETGADGVHIGQEDTNYAEARRMVGTDGIVGVTCHNSRDLAVVAADQGADYVAFGAFFSTDTKEPKTRATSEILSWWSTMTTVPCVAIGGITVANCPPLIAAGANFLAVVSAVWDHPEGPAAGVRDMNAAIVRELDARPVRTTE